ncbi:MAG: HisA/HisF-related TIM barrel protein [Microbacteriaceae bacterium]|nr:HisA/HisF-related TIM barrel protein [Microbacteriaceae bacterium]
MSALEKRTELELLPAIDISKGLAVRLQQGKADRVSDAVDPLVALQDWLRARAEWIHLVDLDLAFGRGSNDESLQRVVEKLHSVNIGQNAAFAGRSVRVQISGGIACEQTLQKALAYNPTRVNLSTAALADMAWVESAIARYGEKISISLDVHGDRLQARGGDSDHGNIWDVLRFLDSIGCARYVVTDVLKDGALQGTNSFLLEKVLENTSSPVVASGGVTTLADIEQLRQLVPQGLEGAIVGKALYAGRFTLEQALAAATE